MRPNAGIEHRLRFVASQATQASWSFRVEDHARDAELFVDGRPRDTGCDRAGQELRCELRGLFPGGHVVELRLPGALLRRTVVIGRPWPERPLLVRARTFDEVVAAADAGADGVVLDTRHFATTPDLADAVDAAHARSARAVIIGDASTIETTSADALLDADVPSNLAARFPEARSLHVVAAPVDTSQLSVASSLVELHGPDGAALSLAAARGAIVDASAFPMLRARKRHAALRTAPKNIAIDAGHVVFTVEKGHDVATVYVNRADIPWSVRNDVTPSLVLVGPTDSPALVAAPHAAVVVQGATFSDPTRQ